ncbi:MAG TPA: DsrE family protein [Burkholderiales bacterium]|nr:DsrE family protein [Burkholderiales bacterium]
MKLKLAILLWATGPDQPHLCATPFFHAAAAAAMDIEVEIYFTSKSVLLLVPGVAAKLFAGRDHSHSVYSHMVQAAAEGAKFFACSDAMAAHGVDKTKLIPEFRGVGGAAAFMARVLDESWSTLTY